MKSIILAGGAGTRLWPKSRKFWPKFLLNFGDKKSLLQKTYQRISKISDKKDIFFICNKEHKYLIKENILDLKVNFSEEYIITEPEIRNTLPAIGVGAKFCLQKYGDDVLGIFPSDHYIKDEKKFLRTIKQAEKLAKEGFVVIFGIKPTRAETGYGYIKVSNSKLRIKEFFGYKVEKFIEKPDLTKAKKLLEQRNVYWNSGMFMFKSSVILEEIKKYEPQIYSLIEKWDCKIENLDNIYSEFPSISIDKSVIEKTDKLIFLPLNIFWDDVGSWAALERIYKKDKNQNVIIGENVDIDSRNISVFGDKRLIATAGLKDLIIVDTEDALLVVSKGYTEKVKFLVEKNHNSETISYHKTTLRPWGYYTVLEHKNGYKLKIIKVLPKKRLSLQKHQKRNEQWFVVFGRAKIILGNKNIFLNKGESITIPKNTNHRLENPSCDQELEIVEIAHGKYIGEDDIIRMEDDFCRK